MTESDGYFNRNVSTRTMLFFFLLNAFECGLYFLDDIYTIKNHGMDDTHYAVLFFLLITASLGGYLNINDQIR